jgi:hypothetical protein
MVGAGGGAVNQPAGGDPSGIRGQRAGAAMCAGGALLAPGCAAGAHRRRPWCAVTRVRHGGRVSIVVSGLPGTGKTAVAAALSAPLGAVHLSVDRIEDALLGAGLPPSWETGVAAYEAARAVAG